MPAPSAKQLKIVKVTEHDESEMFDQLAMEEPLEVRLAYGPENDRQLRSISVTMRTPGNDAELATGFLFTEGIITKADEIADVAPVFIACAENKENVIQLGLKPGIEPKLQSAERNFYTTSSCGVCGKASINSIRTVVPVVDNEADFTLDRSLLYTLPAKLLAHQEVFSTTGGLHASALFDTDGGLLLVREDVGRHNALDKLIGAALNQNWLPLNNHVLLLSGRASFELVQKAAMAGIRLIAAVGAPSTLAVSLAEEFGITLIGFLRGQRFNIYSAAHRIYTFEHEDSH